jgi:hypothetical protein
VAEQMLPAVEVDSRSYTRGAFHTIYYELTALEHSAFKKRMATAHCTPHRMLPARNVEEETYRL